MSRLLKVALVQHACCDDRESNLAASLTGISEATAQGAELVLLPELHVDRYFCQSEDPRQFNLAETIPGPTTERLGQAARQHRAVIVGSVFEKRAPGLYHNTAVVLERDGSLAGRYRKMHIPDDPGYHEKFYFTPGDLGFRPIATSVGRLGVLVCWDQWYPEAARLMALAGAEILLYPTAIGWDPTDDAAEQARQLESWRTIQRAHAVANALPVAACNRVGAEPSPGSGGQIRFWGQSFVCGPQGDMLVECGNEPRIAAAVVDLDGSERLRRIWPFLRDRRIDAYAGLTERFLDGP